MLCTYTTPAESSGQVVAGTKGQYAHREGYGAGYLVQDRQHPSHGPVAAARQHPEIRDFFVQFQTHFRTAPAQVEHLSGVQVPLELLQQLYTLIAAGFRVNKYYHRLDVQRRDRFDHEQLVLFVRLRKKKKK